MCHLESPDFRELIDGRYDLGVIGGSVATDSFASYFHSPSPDQVYVPSSDGLMAGLTRIEVQLSHFSPGAASSGRFSQVRAQTGLGAESPS